MAVNLPPISVSGISRPLQRYTKTCEGPCCARLGDEAGAEKSELYDELGSALES